ncbi:endoribonuclease rege-1-like isoform X1 [Cataglyphis hispanica]|uniref:endoribonuclease rege-1-like isoform X1 n=1 Tax=Cataglyphis hispanica TaxID=1086592 RepID=UPI0021801CBF|nr:endoribonuclease rege-1-like isoform X1 [Cataglyphis hispanica]
MVRVFPRKRRKKSQAEIGTINKRRYQKFLNYLKESPGEIKKVRNLVNNAKYERTGMLTRGMLQKFEEQNALFSLSKKRSSRNSVIIINDSDNESNGKEEDPSLSIIECSPTTLPSSSQQKLEKKELRRSLRQNKNRSSITLSNLSIIESPSTQSLYNGENIAPSQKEDDVIELWSSLKNSTSNTCEKSTKYDETNEKVKFVIDTKPNLEYLEYLKMNTEPVQKRQKRCHNSDKVTLPSYKNRKKRQYIDNTDSIFSQSNAQSCEKETKTIVSDEQNTLDSSHKLREIIVDGCNVGMAHSHHRVFSVKGIQLVVDYFTIRGHVVKVFLPNYFRKFTLLEDLYKKGIVVFTPSRNVDGRQITPYDDRFILEYATACRGIVISSDQYRDLYEEKPEWRDTILNRLLTPTFVGDYIMFPEDPLGKSGPNLETFLRH